MVFKIIVVIVLIFIAISLFSALRTLVRNKDDDKQRTVRFLAFRVGFSVLLLILLGVAMLMGWIEPHGLQPVATPATPASTSSAPATETQPVTP
ncbi:MAG TPA: twin transmembrane helix small protein [Dongiaceae bacterium]|nr:twin transmembrane helix small protein [Dongiaceae bacterium]